MPLSVVIKEWTKDGQGPSGTFFPIMPIPSPIRRSKTIPCFLAIHQALSVIFLKLELPPPGNGPRLRLKDAITDHRWIKTTIQNEIDLGQESSSLSEFSGQSKMFLVSQNDSTKMPLPSKSVDFVVTDPPYFNSVQYSDLSHFFRCWLKTFLPDQSNWHYVTQSSAVAESEENEAKFGLSWANMARMQ